MRQHPLRAAQKGFTLIEIMVVIIIIGVIAGAVVPQILGAGDKSRVKATEITLSKVAGSLNLYKTENYQYPSTSQGLAALKTNPGDAPNYNPEGYLDGTYTDGWDNELQYYAPGQNGTGFDLYSLGADGQPGGEGVDADIEYVP